MTIKSFIYIFILLVAGLPYSCEKDDDSIDEFPITLYASKLTHVSNVRLFINKTEIYDSEAIINFIQNADCFNLPNDIQKSDMSMIFHSKDSVHFFSNTYGFTVQKNAKQFLFYSSDLMHVDDKDIIRPLLMYTDELKPVPFNNGIRDITREVRVGYGSYSDIELSFLSYKISKNTDWSSQCIWGNLMNEFNESSINTLNENDTLAIQEYKIKFIAK